MPLNDGELILPDLNNELNRRLNLPVTPVQAQRIEQIKRLREEWKKTNYQAGAAKRNLKRLAGEVLSDKEINDQLRKQGFIKRDLSLLDNELNRLQKKDFFINVHTEVENPWRVSTRKLLSLENPALYIAERYKAAAELALERGQKEVTTSEEQLRGLEKLLSKINKNIELIEEGEVTYEDEEEELDETDPPIFLEFAGEDIYLIP